MFRTLAPQPRSRPAYGPTRSWMGALLALPLASAVYACSGNSGDADEAAGGTGGTGNSAGNGSLIGTAGKGGSFNGSGGGATVTSGGTSSCVIEDDGSGCVGESHEGENIPLDIYIMFDQSGSMCSCIDPPGGQRCPDPDCEQTRMDAVREAAKLFLADPASQGIGVGIGYFGKQPIGEASCAVDDYSEPAVPIGLLPGNADAIAESLADIEPTGETPTGSAIRGACEYAQQHKVENPQRQIVILLLTDGKPEAPSTCQNGAGPCCPTLSDAVDAADECRKSDARVRTFVLGVGPLLDNLEEIAIAGGTEHAYLVEGGDVAAEVLDALNRIRGDAAIPCEFGLPEPPAGQTLAVDQVNITYASAGCEATHYYYVESSEQCAEGGWHYDDPSAPQKILLCPGSCDQVSAPGGQLMFTVGCTTRVEPR